MAKYEELYIDQGSDIAVQIYLVNDDGSAKNLHSHSVGSKLFTSKSFKMVFKTELSIVFVVEINFTDSDGTNVVERVLEGRIHVTPSVT